MGKVTVMTSGKGGTGKSTVTAGLAAAFIRRGDRVLVIDCDAGMRGIDLMLGVSGELVFDMADILSGNCPPASAIYPCRMLPGLFILPAPQNVQDEASPYVMRHLVKVLEKYYDHVLIDCPAGIGSGFDTAVSSAQRAVLVVNPEPLSLRGCEKVRRKLQRYPLEEVRLIINRFDKGRFRKMGLFADLDEVIDTAGARLLGVVPEDRTAAARAQKGEPIGGSWGAASAFERIAARLDGVDAPLEL